MARTHQTLTSLFTDIAEQIRLKKGSSEDIVADNFPSEIASIPVGGNTPTWQEEGVNFIDYDGTLLYSFTTQEFLATSELPQNPTHEGLTSQGWNWTWASIVDYLTDVPDACLVVGQMYTTSDGKTKIVIDIDNSELAIALSLTLTGNCIVNWGDGSQEEPITGGSGIRRLAHTYQKGKYTITISGGTIQFTSGSSGRDQIISNGSVRTYENRSTQKIVKEIYIGSNLSQLGAGCFGNFPIYKITIPNTCQASADIFSDVETLNAVVIPTSINSGLSFNSWYSLEIVSLPYNYSNYARNMFNNCYALKYIVLTKNSTVNTSLGRTQQLKKISIPSSLNSMSSSAIATACFNLTNIDLPDIFTTLSASSFNAFYSLSKFVVKSRITNIEAQCFYEDCLLTELKFEPTTPPTVANANAFYRLVVNCKILVPRGTLEAYKTATNYPSPSTYTYEEYD